MITTPLSEPSLDVSRRLGDLQTWQAEWQRIDHLLEEQLMSLEGTKLPELQQQAVLDISNMRRRMEMTLVKTPLTIPETVLTRLGVRQIRDQFAGQVPDSPRRNGSSG